MDSLGEKKVKCVTGEQADVIRHGLLMQALLSPTPPRCNRTVNPNPATACACREKA